MTPALDLAALGARVRALREEQGLAREALAYQAGVSTSTLRGLETGRHDPLLRSVASVAAVLGTTIDDLIRTEEAP